MVLAQWKVTVVLLLLITPSLWGSEQGQEQEDKAPAVETIVGKLVRVAAIGGETTGWVVQLDAERKLDDATVKQVEVDPRPRSLNLEPFQGKRVEVTGALTWRQGVERGQYPVLLIETIRE